jgi:hypothetical protein
MAIYAVSSTLSALFAGQLVLGLGAAFRTSSDVADVFYVQRPLTGPRTRQVNAARCISYRKPSYHFPALHKGDVIAVNEGNDQIDFAYLGNVVQSIRKPLRQQTATTRKVQTGGFVKFKQ